jgi:hypothetical protein
LVGGGWCQFDGWSLLLKNFALFLSFPKKTPSRSWKLRLPGRASAEAK